MISIQSLSKSWDEGITYSVKDFNLQVDEGMFVVLLGESGCGKTTTLKMINRLIEPTSGTILLNGENTQEIDPPLLRRRIGYVFQEIGLFPHITIRENISIVPKLLEWPSNEIQRRTDELMALIGLSAYEYAQRMPSELSGGQRQRVGLARALAARPRVMLMDEPFGALDPITRDALQEDYKRLHRELNLTTVMVTHDMTEALLMADRIVVMKAGKILQLGTPHELMRNPMDDYVRQLLDMPKRQADRLEALFNQEGE